MAGRRLRLAPDQRPRPVYVVWELTLKCDLHCTHCGSRAGHARPDELTVPEALDVVKQLAEMGTREVVLIGGEAYLYEGFLEVIHALDEAGITAVMTTGGRGVTSELARQMKEAGLSRVSVSIDGLRERHDRMRALKGSYDAAIAALHHGRAAGLIVGANTNLNRLNHGDLEALFDVFVAQGVATWQVQLTTPLGRAADRTEMTLQPYDLLDIVPRLAALKRKALEVGMTMLPGNNLGYFGPEETLLRSPRPDREKDHWQGCQAGRFVMGIESDGAVKGCPSLQTSHYVGGHLRERKLASIWDETPELRFSRDRTVDELWGFCATCPFKEPCRGGCSFTAQAIMGRRGNNPYCHYRARHFEKQGQRERLVPKAPAPGQPFDNGTFTIVVESLDAPEPQPDLAPAELVQITRKPTGGARKRPR